MRTPKSRVAAATKETRRVRWGRELGAGSGDVEDAPRRTTYPRGILDRVIWLSPHPRPALDDSFFLTMERGRGKVLS